jgi:hypothetical protein
LNLEPFKQTCFFQDLTQVAAQKAASEAIAVHKENPNGLMKEQCTTIFEWILRV